MPFISTYSFHASSAARFSRSHAAPWASETAAARPFSQAWDMLMPSSLASRSRDSGSVTLAARRTGRDGGWVCSRDWAWRMPRTIRMMHAHGNCSSMPGIGQSLERMWPRRTGSKHFQPQMHADAHGYPCEFHGRFSPSTVRDGRDQTTHHEPSAFIGVHRRLKILSFAISAWLGARGSTFPLQAIALNVSNRCTRPDPIRAIGMQPFPPRPAYSALLRMRSVKLYRRTTNTLNR
jgi:hypothetical protein